MNIIIFFTSAILSQVCSSTLLSFLSSSRTHSVFSSSWFKVHKSPLQSLNHLLLLHSIPLFIFPFLFFHRRLLAFRLFSGKDLFFYLLDC
jgi:hypothetical protein